MSNSGIKRYRPSSRQSKDIAAAKNIYATPQPKGAKFVMPKKIDGGDYFAKKSM